MNSARITTCPITLLEFVEGGSLARKIRGKPLPPLDAARIAEELARAIQYCHQHAMMIRASCFAFGILRRRRRRTRLDFHSSIQVDSFRNVLTGEQVPVRRESDQASMNLADALSICPVALLQARIQGK